MLHLQDFLVSFFDKQPLGHLSSGRALIGEGQEQARVGSAHFGPRAHVAPARSALLIRARRMLVALAGRHRP